VINSNLWLTVRGRRIAADPYCGLISVTANATNYTTNILYSGFFAPPVSDTNTIFEHTLNIPITYAYSITNIVLELWNSQVEYESVKCSDVPPPQTGYLVNITNAPTRIGQQAIVGTNIYMSVGLDITNWVKISP
jgi:hypothetical protein